MITVSDIRFPEELDIIYNSFKNVYKINVIRPNYENNLNSSEKKHITELALDNYNNYDYTIINDSSLNDLNIKVINMIDEVL